MKTIGLIGGISWQSTQSYYKLINTGVQEKLGGLHSAEILMWSYDFSDIEALQVNADWDKAAQSMIKVAQKLEKGGAKCLLICANTMHKIADAVQDSVNIPLIHVADATAQALKKSNAKNTLLLGTRYTMEDDFYRGHILRNHGIDLSVPPQGDRDNIHNIIYDELCKGIINSHSKSKLLDIINRATNEGVDSVILGCTEISMLINQSDLDIPTFDTTKIHAEAAVNFALS